MTKLVLFALLVSAAAADATPRDGQHDFDFEVGTWKIHLKRLKARLVGSHEWIEFDGTSVTRPLWGGKSQVEEFEVDSPIGGRIEGMTVRLYSPTTHEWSLNWANQHDGHFDTPTIGSFSGDRGEFYDMEPWEGRTVLVRFVWSKITPKSAHFEQSFSTDGGKTWEVNWITDQTRVE
ncbi:MAG TPA: hypothetical protein VLX92_25690 [Kofleriaceae bacterium]|nr:hypothetical protein [Kofleriaceae bacterium]